MTESYPLKWPDGWPRLRTQDRRPMSSWKRRTNQYLETLTAELRRMESPHFVVSSNVPMTSRGTLHETSLQPLDVGVAVYFSRKLPEDFSWQDALGLHDPAPTEDQIDAAYRRLAQLYHPDVAGGGDKELFQAATDHRDRARQWVRRKSNDRFDYVIACDQFKEVRLNIAAIGNTIKAIRQIERCGTSSLLERAFKGFSAITEKAGA